MIVEELAGLFSGMARVGETAKFLGVSKETLRNRYKSGKLIPTRHPVTGYRYYSQDDLNAFLKLKIAERSAFTDGSAR